MFGKVRRGAADRDDAVLPAQPVRRGQGLRPLDHRELPRELRPARHAAASCSTTRSPRRGLEFVDAQGHATASPASSSASTPSCASATWTPQRDWGFAGDYVEAMWLMLQQDEPDDFVMCHRRDALGARVLRARVRPRRARLRATTSSSTSSSSGRPRSTCSSAIRPRHETMLGWKPKTSFAELVRMMVDADLDLLSGRLRHS